eukprot:TRINITY_DN17275_c0_g1_i1.p1 TRINITY_DN17275_c0_g1~~TRINITY_DN17275_c0_g1_i1.p1  ORF type:complete len:139 (-),score=27.80 TRINITY_DN17275_c0_g1_i1:323-739(-)
MQGWKDKWKAFSRAAATNVEELFQSFLSNVEDKIEDVLHDPLGDSQKLVINVKDEVYSVANEFVTYCGAGQISGEFLDWILILSQVSTKQDLDRMLDVEVERLKSYMKGILHKIEDRKFIREFMLRHYFCEILGRHVP